MRHVLFGLLVAACSHASPPRGQVLLYFDTDAPVPPAAGRSLGPDDPIPIFDTLRVEIYEPGASVPCANCTREFALDVARMSDCSIGIIETPNTQGWRVRGRMFRAASVRVPPDPPEGSSLTVVANLPAVGETGIAERTLVLRMADFGMPRGDLQSPVDTKTSRAAPTRSGDGDRPVSCSRRGRAHRRRISARLLRVKERGTF